MQNTKVHRIYKNEQNKFAIVCNPYFDVFNDKKTYSIDWETVTCGSCLKSKDSVRGRITKKQFEISRAEFNAMKEEFVNG